MDLAKIIAELRAELQCLDGAIASIEELARVQNMADGEIRTAASSEPESGPPEPGPENAPPVKRGRGRPRKNEVRNTGESRQPIDAGATQSRDGSTASAA